MPRRNGKDNKDKPLTPMQEAFAQAYVRTNDVNASAKIAGYSAGHSAMRIISNAAVKARIGTLIREKIHGSGVNPALVVREIDRIARADIRRLFREDGSLVPVHELDDATAAAVVSIELDTRHEGRAKGAEIVHTKKIRLADKVAALGLLARHVDVAGQFTGDKEAAIEAAKLAIAAVDRMSTDELEQLIARRLQDSRRKDAR